MSARTYQHALAPAFPVDAENTGERELAPTVFDVELSAEDLADLSIMYDADQAHEKESNAVKTREVTILEFNVGGGFIDVATRPSDPSRVWIHFSHADASVYLSLDEGFACALSMRLGPIIAQICPERRKTCERR
jgi:hypothetical protein